MEDICMIGHHGTNFENCNKILNSNYQISKGDEHWLGDGVYFFVKGVSSKTIDLAEKWAIAASWDKANKTNKYTKYVVLESQIKVQRERFLDLTTEEGISILLYFLDKYFGKLKELGKGLNFYDGLLINLMRGERVFDIDVVKGNFYIKFEKERKYRVNLRTCNCTICAVYNPHKNINSTKVINKGVIK